MAAQQTIANGKAPEPGSAGGWQPADDNVHFIGNATLLIRFGDLTILTDPNFVHRGAEVELGFGVTATRRTDPALDAEELPPVDAVIVSHHHGDHFDAVADDLLAPDVPIFTTPAAAAHLADRGFSAVRGLQTWESAELERGADRLRVTALPAHHAPPVLAPAFPDTMGSLVELWRDGEPDPVRIYVSGDTILHDDLDEIATRFPRIDLAFLHLGGARLLGMNVGLDAAQGVELVSRIGAAMAVPVHYDDYGTSRTTLAEFVGLVQEAGLQDRVRYLRPGDSLPLGGAVPAGLPGKSS